MSVSRTIGWKLASALLAAGSLIMVAAVSRFVSPPFPDTTADNVLGQPDFVHNAANTPDAKSMFTNGGLARVAIDKSVSPNRVYVADTRNSRVLGYSSITALVNGAAANIVIGQPDFFSASCNTLGPSAKSLCGPEGVAVDSTGNLWVSDSNANNRVLEYNHPFAQSITSGFTANVVLGQGGSFTATACNNGGGPSKANFCDPEGIALDAGNHLWVADRTNSRVLEFNAPLTSDAANLVIGQPKFNTGSCNNGGVTKSSLCHADDVALDSNGNLYVSDYNNSRVLEYNTPLTVTGIAGSGDGIADRVWGQAGSFTASTCNNGGVSATSLCTPAGVGLDSSNKLYTVDTSNNRILEYDETTNPPSNTVANHVFGQGGSFTATNACNQGGLSAASLCNPQDVALSSSGLVAMDTSNNRVLKYNTPLFSQTANVVLGQPDFLHNAANSVDAEGMNGAHGITVDKNNHLYVADEQNSRVLGYTSTASFANGAPANLVIGQPDLFSGGCNNLGLSSSSLCNPLAVATDSAGNLYVSDLNNHRVLEYNAPFSQGISHGFTAHLVFGQAGSFTSNTCNLGGESAATLCNPDGLAVDVNSNLYVADRSNNRVVEYNTPLTVTAISGSGDTTADKEFGQGSAGTDFSHQNCGLSASSLCNPFGVAADASKNVYIADHDNNRVLEYKETTNPPGNFTANLEFGQGNGSGTDFTHNSPNSSGVNATGLNNPHKVTLDSQANLYVSDNANNRVLEYNTPLTVTSIPGSGNTTADMVFGQANSFTSNQCNFNGGPSNQSLCAPVGVALDTTADLLVGDFNNNRVLKFLKPLATPGAVTLSPSPLNFGKVATGSSLTLNVHATNTGSVPVLFTGLTITGTNAADFKVASNACSGYISAGVSCLIGVTFKPTSPAGTAETAKLTVFDNGSNSPQADTLNGTSDT